MNSQIIIGRIIKKISHEMNLPYAQVKQIIDSMMEGTKRALSMKSMPRVLWRGFGIFQVSPARLHKAMFRLDYLLANNYLSRDRYDELHEQLKAVQKRRLDEELYRNKKHKQDNEV